MVNKKANLLSNIYTYFILFFLYAPIFVLILFSFNNSAKRITWVGFTTKWYVEILEEDIMNALFITLSIALIATLAATLIGTISAIGIYNLKAKRKKLALRVNSLPILNPDIVTGISLMILFLAVSFKLGYFTMLLAHIIFDTPYVILAILPKLKQLNPNIMEAALDLGATPQQAIRKVLLPQLSPGIITGALIAFTMSVDDFVISYFTTGNGVNNLSIWIYNQTKKGITPEANAISTIMLFIVITLLTIIFIRLSNDFKKKETVK
jgi:spermidine/putrescine transport system permease protein